MSYCFGLGEQIFLQVPLFYMHCLDFIKSVLMFYGTMQISFAIVCSYLYSMTDLFFDVEIFQSFLCCQT